jgi:stringent starvation protein B
MNPLRPYLIRALYDWVLDNNATPHLLVDAEGNGVNVPLEYVEEGRIVLNIAPGAVQSLELGDVAVSFRARFGGTPRQVYIPVASVLALYARENGQGMVFTDVVGDPPPPPPGDGGGNDPENTPPSRPNLRVVK